MEEVEVTYKRSLKLWWSFVWRGMALMLILMIPMQIVMMTVVVPNLPKPGAGPPDPEKMRQAFKMFAILWPIMFFGMIALQVQGMRWMLRRARWSDFRIVLARSE